MKMALILFLFPLFLIGVFGDDVESVSVMKEDSVTLHTGRNINKDEVFEWKHGDFFFARVNCGKTGKIIVSVNETVKGRVQMDNQTGDLKIMKIKDSDSGRYKLFIEESPSKEFSLIVPGVDAVKSVSVIVGDSVTLNSGNNIQRDDVIQWRFADLNSPIAEHNRKTGNFSTSDGPDGIFRHRLQLNYSTGSLTIRNITNHHSGLYEAGIRKSSGYTIHQSYSVTVTGERKPALSVMTGDYVPLHTDLTEIHTDDLMLWMFEDTVIAEINKADDRYSTSDDGPDGRFRDRLKLDHQTGSLTITHTITEDSGLYELKISSSRFSINKRIIVIVSDPALSSGAVAGIVVAVLACAAAVAAGVIYYRRKISELKEWFYKWRIRSVMEGEPVTLNLDVNLIPKDTDVHKDDTLVWMFRSIRIAERNSGADSFTVHDDAPDGRFKDRLKLNPQTGSLTITHTRTTDSGLYELMIFRPGKGSIKRFNVSVFAKTSDIKPVSVNEGKSVTLPTGVTDIKTVEQIQWKFGYILLAKIKEGTKKISQSAADGMFKGRLELDHQTGSLIINKIRPTDAGIYMLYKIEKGHVQMNLFRVSVSDSTDNSNNPKKESVKMDNSENVPLNSVETFPDSRL